MVLTPQGQLARYFYGVEYAPRDVRLARLEARGVDRADAEARMAAQADDGERRKLATYVVDNAGDRAALERQVDEVWADLERRHREQADST